MSKSSRRALVIGVVALILVAIGVSWYVARDPDATAGPGGPSPSGTATTSAADPSTAAPQTAAGTPTDDPAACDALGAGFVPTQFEIPDHEVVSPVLSLGRDENDAAAAPPKDASHTTGWFNEGPMAGSTAGKVLLTIHTYRNGGALGNEMYEDGPKKVEIGDRMVLRDESGNVACYQVSAIEKIWVSEYDPDSDAIYDNDGDPRIAIVICWDFNDETEDWDSRIVYYADPVVPDGASPGAEQAPGNDNAPDNAKPSTAPSN